MELEGEGKESVSLLEQAHRGLIFSRDGDVRVGKQNGMGKEEDGKGRKYRLAWGLTRCKETSASEKREGEERGSGKKHKVEPRRSRTKKSPLHPACRRGLSYSLTEVKAEAWPSPANGLRP